MVLQPEKLPPLEQEHFCSLLASAGGRCKIQNPDSRLSFACRHSLYETQYLASTGKVVYTLKTPYRDGTTQVAFEPVDFIPRLAALVPKPHVNLTRYHGVLACAARP
jgi:hypothetical protein